ncbi:hypothetical protein EV121DRAFT_295775 [Schizophyllum commune]
MYPILRRGCSFGMALSLGVMEALECAQRDIVDVDWTFGPRLASERPIIVDFAEPPQRPDLIKRVEGSLHVEARKLMNNKRRSCLLSCRANLDITAP